MKNSGTSAKEFIKLAFNLLTGFKKSALYLALFSVIYEVIRMVPPYLVKLVIDGIFGQAALRQLVLLVLWIFISLCLISALEIVFVVTVARISARQQRNVLHNAFKKVLSLPMSWHENQNTGATISKLSKASNYSAQLVWFLSNEIFPILIQLVLTTAFIFWIDWRIGLLYLVVIPILVKLIDSQFRSTQKYRQVYHENYDLATREFAQALYNVQTVKDFGKERFEEKHHDGFLQKFMHWINLRGLHTAKTIAPRTILQNAVRAGTLLLAIKFVFDGSLTPGDLVLLFTLSEKAIINLHRLGRIYNFMGDTHEALERAMQVQQTANDLADKGTKKAKNGDIFFDDVSFSYIEDEPVLKNVAATFVKGKITALVGPSGGGKSTIVKLIMRHYDPSKGSISLAGEDLRNITLSNLRDKITFVSQHTELFDRSIAENISYGDPKASRKKIIAAAKQANAHEFILKFSKGYDTIIGEKGVRLSGGQRQRLAIARALLANPEIIIFDEATSSLDSESEIAIQKAVFSIKNKTLIIIAHRLSTIEHADHIIVVQDGKIAESGTHADLIKKRKGIYRKMRKLQQLGELRS